jgi:hypothetical protein
MLTLIPAYGRDYKSRKEVEADWNADKDFILRACGHPYDNKPANKSDLAAETGQVMIRYKGLRQVAIFKTK